MISMILASTAGCLIALLIAAALCWFVLRSAITSLGEAFSSSNVQPAG